MAAGEFVSVHSQENADLARARAELKQNPAGEQRELAGIYVGRGQGQSLAEQVAGELMAHDALGSHGRDELGLSETTAARPTQAALTSAASFSAGAVLPIAVVVVASPLYSMLLVSIASIGLLAGLGAVSAGIGGAPVWNGTWRVAFWGQSRWQLLLVRGALFGAVA